MTDHASAHGKTVLRQQAPLHRELRRAIPDVYAGFGALHQAAFAGGALDVRTKELIALAIGPPSRHTSGAPGTRPRPGRRGAWPGCSVGADPGRPAPAPPRAAVRGAARDHGGVAGVS